MLKQSEMFYGSLNQFSQIMKLFLILIMLKFTRNHKLLIIHNTKHFERSYGLVLQKKSFLTIFSDKQGSQNSFCLFFKSVDLVI